MTKLNKITCPRCGKEGTWTPENKYKPFCSERCKMIDLGAWAEEKYKVAGEKVEKDEPREGEE